MNLFNRVLATLLLVVVAVGSLATAVAPATALAVLRQQLALLEIAPADQIYISLACVAIAVTCGVLVFLELRRPTVRAVALAKLPEGIAEFATDSVAQRLKHEVEALPDVRLVTPRVTSRGNSVDIEVAVQTSPDVDIPNKTSEVYQAIRTNLDQMGLKLGKLRVNMRYSPYPTSLPQKAR